MDQEHPIIPHDFVKDFGRRHHIKKLSIFGSYLPEDFGPESDIDFLVEFDPQPIPSFFDVATWRSSCPSLSSKKWTCEPHKTSDHISVTRSWLRHSYDIQQDGPVLMRQMLLGD
jgi:predicted nucleotidyltransferase